MFFFFFFFFDKLVDVEWNCFRMIEAFGCVLYNWEEKLHLFEKKGPELGGAWLEWKKKM